jgi:hypothetical protein
MTTCPGCCTSLHEGQDYLMHCMCCVYFRVAEVRRAMDKLAEPEQGTHLLTREARLHQSEGALRAHARRGHA